jgi:hypothetical protein
MNGQIADSKENCCLYFQHQLMSVICPRLKIDNQNITSYTDLVESHQLADL